VDRPDRPPGEEPAPDGDDERGDGDAPVEPDPGGGDIKDPLPREKIKYFAEERLLGVTLEGPKVGERTIDVFVLSEFLGQLDRVVRGLTAWARNIPLEPTGKIPTPPDAAPWRSRGVQFAHSATLEFVLGQPEALRLSDEGTVSSPTIEAVERLGQLVELDALPAVDQLREMDDRIGRDFARLLALLADNDIESHWEPANRKPTTLLTERADRVRAILRSEAPPETAIVNVTGFLFQLDAKKNDFKIQPADADAITGSYDDALVDELRDAWRHRVLAEVTRTERRYTYATHPHKVDHSLNRILERHEPVD
jgi:hypothetical protein